MIDTDKLDAAADLVAQAIEEADVRESRCEVCDRVSHRNWIERQAHVELEAAMVKLVRWAGKLRSEVRDGG